jgi:hypothetical protein
MAPAPGSNVSPRDGRPRLVVAAGGRADAGSPSAAGVEEVFLLDGDVVTLGGADTQTIRVPDAPPEAAEIVWSADTGDWVFTDVNGGASRVDGARVLWWPLRHGDRIEIGPVTFIFQRDEDANTSPT